MSDRLRAILRRTVQMPPRRKAVIAAAASLALTISLSVLIPALVAYSLSSYAARKELSSGGRIAGIEGRPRAIVVVHGWSSGEWHVAKMARELEESLGVPVYSCELSTRGRRRHIDEFAEELGDYIDGLGFEPATEIDIVGFSLGGTC